jgi:hypothetical protein
MASRNDPSKGTGSERTRNTVDNLIAVLPGLLQLAPADSDAAALVSHTLEVAVASLSGGQSDSGSARCGSGRGATAPPS